MFQSLCIPVLCLAIGWQNVEAFAPTISGPRASSSLHLHKKSSTPPNSRRTFLTQQIIAPAIASVATATTTTLPIPAHADVLLMDKSSPDVPPFNGGATEAKQRFKRAIKDIDNLLANYDEISKSGGDNVRLYLGTQGVKSNMYGIIKVLKSLKEEADDIVEYTEAINEFEAYLFQAEGAAYQSMFTEHSSAKSTPESLLKTARGDIVNMRKFMGDLALQLSLDA